MSGSITDRREGMAKSNRAVIAEMLTLLSDHAVKPGR